MSNVNISWDILTRRAQTIQHPINDDDSWSINWSTNLFWVNSKSWWIYILSIMRHIFWFNDWDFDSLINQNFIEIHLFALFFLIFPPILPSFSILLLLIFFPFSRVFSSLFPLLKPPLLNLSQLFPSYWYSSYIFFLNFLLLFFKVIIFLLKFSIILNLRCVLLLLTTWLPCLIFFISFISLFHFPIQFLHGHQKSMIQRFPLSSYFHLWQFLVLLFFPIS